MKKYYLGLSIGFLALTATFMATSVAGTKAADETSPLLTTNPCAYMDSSGKVLNIYNNPNLTTDKIISLYHEKTNDEFNRYIGLMIKSASVKSMLIDKNGSAPVNDGECASNRDNYSTFCVAHNMLSDEEQGDGYMQYLAALQCRSGDLSEDMNSLAQPVEYISGIVQEVAYTTYSIRQGAIEREKNTAKRALDQTLSAYDELKTAWLMHKKYIEIYEALLTYRDKMVEIRHQVEEFPAKFIDATTTKCT
ncbi:hypothetical protein KJ951_00510 [Patescibacteria group bacterium]|nr:hypothetical protein [Patescibacteria group bacterium]MBU1702864.1 hypothetical protein [Patescibacteria group bacterium]